MSFAILPGTENRRAKAGFTKALGMKATRSKTDDDDDYR